MTTRRISARRALCALAIVLLLAPATPAAAADGLPGFHVDLAGWWQQLTAWWTGGAAVVIDVSSSEDEGSENSSDASEGSSEPVLTMNGSDEESGPAIDPVG